MAKTTKTPATEKARRERILNAATDSFLELGFERTSTAEIARRANVSKREIYADFADKRMILSAVIAELQNQMQFRLRGIWSSSENPEIVLPKAAARISDFVLSERFGKLVRIVAAESYHDSQIARKFYELGPDKGREETAGYMKSQMKQGRLLRADPIKAADDFMNMVVGGQLMTAVILGQVDRVPLRRGHVKHAVELFLKNYLIE